MYTSPWNGPPLLSTQMPNGAWFVSVPNPTVLFVNTNGVA